MGGFLISGLASCLWAPILKHWATLYEHLAFPEKKIAKQTKVSFVFPNMANGRVDYAHSDFSASGKHEKPLNNDAPW